MTFRRNLNQTGTYWAPGANDGQGGVAFAAPVTVDCRFQRVSERFTRPDGVEAISNAVAYTATPLQIQGFFAIGDQTAHANPRDADEAYEIQQRGDAPNLKNTDTLHKAML